MLLRGLMIALVFCACEGVPDAIVQKVIVQPAEPLTASVDSLADDSMTHAIALPNFGIAATAGSDVLWARNASAPLAFVASDVGIVQTMRPAPGVGAFVTGQHGIFVLQDNGVLVPSPIDVALREAGLSTAAETIHSLAVVSDSPNHTREVWLASALATYRWHEGLLQQVDLPAPTPADVTLFAASDFGQTAHLFGIWDQRIYNIVASDTGVDVALAKSGIEATGTTDGAGNLWLVSGGELLQRADGLWTNWVFPGEVVAAMASTAADDLWLTVREVTSSDTDPLTLWHGRGGSFRRVSDVVVDTLLSVGANSELLANSAEGLVRVRPNLVFSFVGVPELAVSEPTTVFLSVPLEELATAMTARVDNTPVEVLRNPARIILSPWLASAGTHALEATVAYEDGSEKSTTAAFTSTVAPSPTWSSDVLPIYESRCALCHGPTGDAERIETRGQWQERIDAILHVLRVGNMPRPPREPLNDTELGFIEGWSITGFSE